MGTDEAFCLYCQEPCEVIRTVSWQADICKECGNDLN